MTDDDRPPVSSREWVDVISRLDLPSSVQLGKTTIAARMVKLVAYRVSWYADGKTGRRVFPGLARLAVECSVTYKAAQYAVRWLRDMGLLTLVHSTGGPQGTKARNADEYRLTIPADLLDRVSVMDPSRHDAVIGRIREANRGKSTPRVAGRRTTRNSASEPVGNCELQVVSRPATDAPARKVAGRSTTRNPELQVVSRPSCRSHSDLPPSSDHVTRATTHDYVPALTPVARDTTTGHTRPFVDVGPAVASGSGLSLLGSTGGAQ